MVAAAAPDDRGRVVLRREQLSCDRVEARQNRLIGSAGVIETDHVRPYRTKHHSDQQRCPLVPVNLSANMIVVHVGRLAPYLEATLDEQP
jgi:hypothetical protein